MHMFIRDGRSSFWGRQRPDTEASGPELMKEEGKKEVRES